MRHRHILATVMIAGIGGSAFAVSNYVERSIAIAPATTPGGGTIHPRDFVPEELIVKFRPTFTPQDIRSNANVRGHRVHGDMKQGWSHIKLGTGESVETALRQYANDVAVESVQPNYIYRATATPNDPNYGSQWGLNLNLEPAWDHVTNCSTSVVAVIDSGVNYNHQDLAANMWSGNVHHGWDFVDNDNDPMDHNGHGTHVAGIIGAAGNNGLGIAGTCWSASIMAVRVLDATGAGTTLSIVQGIDFAVSQGAKVINMSLGGQGPFDPAFNAAINNAQAADVAIIVAAGNSANNNDATPTYPCNFGQSNLMCVAALDQNLVLAGFSNWGANSVDVGAPGTNVFSSWAGTNTILSEDFNSGGALDWTTSGGGWAYSTQYSPLHTLANPGSFPAGIYANNVNQRAYKNFNLTGSIAAVLSFFAGVEVLSGDVFNVNYHANGGDPFSGGVRLVGGSGSTGGFLPFSLEISKCISANCSIGVQLISDASNSSLGVAIRDFEIETLTLNANTYRFASGTSMATPAVAGLAAMLRVYNPRFSAEDTLTALKQGGRPVATLAGKTTAGRAVDAMGSVAYIAAPTGLVATVH